MLETISTRDWGYYINKNAINNPISGVNSFLFRFHPLEAVRNDYHHKRGFEPYMWGWDGNSEHLYNGNTKQADYGCNETSTAYCTKVIEQNGWKIPNDYPFHI